MLLSVVKSTDSVVLDVNVQRGQLQPGTPLCTKATDNEASTYIGYVEWILKGHVETQKATAGMRVRCKISTTDVTDLCFVRALQSGSVLLNLVS